MDDNGLFMSVKDLANIEARLDEFNRRVINYSNRLNEAIKLFESESVAQSFFESGNFGQERREILKRIKTSLDDFANSISFGHDSLVSQTQAYIDQQRNLLGTQLGFDKPISISESSKTGAFRNIAQN